MTGTKLRDHAAGMPKPYDLEHARLEMEDLVAAVAGIEDEATRNQIATLIEAADTRKILEGVFGNSSFLTRIIRQHQVWLPRLIDSTPEDTFSSLLENIATCVNATSQAELMKQLRQAKSEAALLIALADLTGYWPLEKVTHALSAFADASLIVSIDWLLRDAARRGQVLASAETLTAAGSGLAILGMGKYGSYELNYSSDIDFVVFYEPGQLPLKDGLDHGEFFVKLTRALVKIMQERTEDGYVFRTDLRLRPDPGGTPIADSLPAAENYY